jgi:dienelactone hydrolase
MTDMSHKSPLSRTTVQIPTASGDAIEAWCYLPEGSGPHPAVVMAHGIGSIKAGGLSPFAERFREEGFAAIAFDYRNFGGSGGQPREVLSVPRQRADYSTVIGWAVEQPYIDSRQIIVWGTSFAGMHVLELAVSDTRLAAAIAQAPLTDGLAAAMMSPPKNGIRLFGLALLDQLGSLVARKALGAELFRSAGGHYDVYEGGASFADVLRVELDFLRRHAKTPTL